MPSFFKVAVPALALAGSSFANPLKRGNDACAAAVTGKAALGDENLRKEHCSSFIKTIVTPKAITITTTVDDAEPTGWHNYKKRDVTVCPNEVPNYASACDEAGYKSACKAFGISGETTFTIPATTTTKTVYRGKGTGSCTGATATETKTVTEGGKGGVTSTVTITKATATETATVTKGNGDVTTVTVTGGQVGPSGKCISKAKADYFVNGFIELLEYTSYAGNNFTNPITPAGRGYHQNTSDAILDVNFIDYSDSINWMAGFKLGGATFPNKAAFDAGQGKGQAEVEVETLNTWYGCNTITWKWLITTVQGAKVRGINQFTVSDDGEKLISNHAEFNNAGWLYSYGVKCLTPGLPPPTYQK